MNRLDLLDENCTDSPRRSWLLRFWIVGCLLATSFCVFKGLEASSSTRPTTRQRTVTQTEIRRQTRMDEIKVGDVVLARDEFGDTVSPKKVTRVFRRTSDHLRLLTFESRDGTRKTIKTTDEHPFALADSLDFVSAGELSIGTEVPGPKGERQTLVASIREEHPEGVPAFNFEVDGFHTYFVSVLSERSALLVHNNCVPDPRTTPDYNPDATHIDHTLARALGGTDESENLRAVTAALNLRKGGLEGELVEYLEYLIANGMEKTQARKVIQTEIEALARDALPTPFSSLPGLVLPE